MTNLSVAPSPSPPATTNRALILHLETLIDSQAFPAKVATLINHTSATAFPTFLEVAYPGQAPEVQIALESFGFRCFACQGGATELFACFDDEPSEATTTSCRYVYGPDEGNDEEQIFAHFSSLPMTTLDHMKFLYRFGFTRAVIRSEHQVSPSTFQVTFHNNVPQLDCTRAEKGPPTPWPARQPLQPTAVSIDLTKIPREQPNQLLRTGLDSLALETFFDSTKDMLCTQTDHLPLLEVTKQALAQCVDLPEFDRYIIFTDGTSQGWARRHNPHQLEELGKGDAWAFLVLGEKYLGQDDRALT